MACSSTRRVKPYFWIREQAGTTTEVDYLISQGKILALEVKGGAEGRLQALHQFLLKSKQNMGIRVYNGPLSLDFHQVKTPQGQSLGYSLASLPFALVFRLPSLLQKILQKP